jgi:AraC-like DNA-binding protein
LYILVMVRFSLDTLRTIESRIIIAYAGRPEPRMRDIRNRNPYYTFWWVKRGEARLRIDGRPYNVAAGQWVLIPAMADRHHLLDESTELVSLSFHWAWPFGEPVLRMTDPAIGDGKSARSLCHQASQVARLVCPDPLDISSRHLRSGVYDLLTYSRIVAAFQTFLIHLCQVVVPLGSQIVRPDEIDPRLTPILTELTRSPSVGPLPFDRWRGVAGIGREQIDRLARQHLGMSLHAWRTRLLEREIRRRLLSNAAVIKAVAADLGFVDSSHFNRWCVQHLGLRPSQLRGGAA